MSRKSATKASRGIPCDPYLINLRTNVQSTDIDEVTHQGMRSDDAVPILSYLG